MPVGCFRIARRVIDFKSSACGQIEWERTLASPIPDCPIVKLLDEFNRAQLVLVTLGSDDSVHALMTCRGLSSDDIGKDDGLRSFIP